MNYSKCAILGVLAAIPAAFGADNPGWETSATANVAVNKGNSDTLLAGANILTMKKWDKNEFSAGADAVYGNNRDSSGVRTTTAQNYGAFLQYNRLINERLYFFGHVDARQDKVADIRYRVTLSPGLGYYLVKNATTSLSLEAGPGLVLEQFEGQRSHNYFTARFAEKFSHKFNDKVRLVQDADYSPQVDNFSNYVVNAQATIEADLTKKLSATLTLGDTYRSEPAPGRKSNDVRLLAGIKYKF